MIDGGGAGHSSSPDAAATVKGLCCHSHPTPGCEDPALEQCVCSALPECCTKGWSNACQEFIRQEHCEANADDLRSCVCFAWKLAACCDTEWTQGCTDFAVDRCNAKPICP
jgi:hypothetical protein